MKAGLINHFTWVASNLATDYIYENAGKEVKEVFDKFYNSLSIESNRSLIDFNNLTREEAEELRFSKWDSESDLYLIPLYLVPLLPIGIELETIGGEKVVFKGKESIDLDVRFGVISCGINIKGE